MGGCVCSCDFDSEHEPDFFKRWTVTAKKEHRCLECDRVIEPGQKYEYLVGKWGKWFQASRVCAACAEIFDHFECCVLGGLYDELAEFAEDLELCCLDGLSAEAVAKLEEKYGDRWDELAEDEITERSER